MKTLFKKSLLVLMVAFIAVFTLGVSSKVKAASTTYTFSNFKAGTQYAVGEEHVLDNVLTLYTSQCHFTTQLRIYSSTTNNGYVVSNELPGKIISLGFNMGYKKDTLNVYGSTDGSTWTLVGGVATTTTSYKDYTLKFTGVEYTYFKLDVAGSSQIRIASLTVEYESSAPTVTVSSEDDNYTDTIGTTAQLTATVTNTSGTPTWSSSDDSVATVDQSGVVTAKGFGKATITATVNGVEGTYDYIVYPTDGSEITVAEAIEICNLTGSSNSPYKYTVVGTVSSDPTYNEEYNSYTFNLTDETGTIKVYSSVGEGTPVNGNNVSVNGNLILYGSTCEFNYDSTFEILVDSNLADFLENLNTINSYMSLAYEYKTTIKNVATSENKTISFTDTANRVSFSTSSQIWETNGLTVTNNKASSTANVADYSDPVRFYKSSEIKLSSDTAFTTVVFESSANDGSKASQQYLTLLENSLSSLNANYSTEGTTVTLTLAAPVNTLSFVAAGQVRLYTITTKCEGGEQTVYENAEFRIKCAVDSALTSLSGLTGDAKYDWGISVTANGQTKYYNSTSEFIVSDDENNKKYVIISLGDVLNEVTKAKTEFTVRAYVEVDGDKYVSNEFKTYSVESMIKEYNTNEKYSDYKTQIAPLVEVLTSLGCNVE